MAKKSSSRRKSVGRVQPARPARSKPAKSRKRTGAAGGRPTADRARAVGGSAYSKIPSITVLLDAAVERDGFIGAPRKQVTMALRAAVDDLRRRVRDGVAGARDFQIDAILNSAARLLHRRRARRMTRVINATGVILHTGLGRSVLPAQAVERVSQAAGGYCNVEIDLATGRRGRRGDYAESLLCELTGAEAALVVNNNAAATMLALRALAHDREVIVSRGQLIEIGGSYRLPDVMSAGGAVLREVGTTNKTHLRDYDRAIHERTALIMHVHTSNYRIVGFSHMPDAAQLASLAHSNGLLFFDDLGSGAFLDDPMWNAAAEPTVPASLRAGADLVAFSGDKLLGGPQAGILLGREAIIDRLRTNPMARALRVGKLTLAALEATLELYLSPEDARRAIPILAQLGESHASRAQRAEQLASQLRGAVPRESFQIHEDESFAGGGSLPAWPLPTIVVRWTPSSGSLESAARLLRIGEPAVLARIHDGAICFDLRTIETAEFPMLAQAISTLCHHVR